MSPAMLVYLIIVGAQMLHRFWLQPETESLDELYWQACVNPGASGRMS
jgi:hypothetical protein